MPPCALNSVPAPSCGSEAAAFQERPVPPSQWQHPRGHARQGPSRAGKPPCRQAAQPPAAASARTRPAFAPPARVVSPLSRPRSRRQRPRRRRRPPTWGGYLRRCRRRLPADGAALKSARTHAPPILDNTQRGSMLPLG